MKLSLFFLPEIYDHLNLDVILGIIGITNIWNLADVFFFTDKNIHNL